MCGPYITQLLFMAHNADFHLSHLIEADINLTVLVVWMVVEEIWEPQEDSCGEAKVHSE